MFDYGEKIKKTTSDWQIIIKRFFELGSSVWKFRDNRLIITDVVKKQQGLTLGVLFENLHTKIWINWFCKDWKFFELSTMFENPKQKIYLDWSFRDIRVLSFDKKILVSSPESYSNSEFCTICKQWLHNEHETLRNRCAVNSDTDSSPILNPALHLNLFLL